MDSFVYTVIGIRPPRGKVKEQRLKIGRHTGNKAEAQMRAMDNVLAGEYPRVEVFCDGKLVSAHTPEDPLGDGSGLAGMDFREKEVTG